MAYLSVPQSVVEIDNYTDYTDKKIETVHSYMPVQKIVFHAQTFESVQGLFIPVL